MAPHYWCIIFNPFEMDYSDAGILMIPGSITTRTGIVNALILKLRFISKGYMIGVGFIFFVT
jgi:hypothetical protein